MRGGEVDIMQRPKRQAQVKALSLRAEQLLAMGDADGALQLAKQAIALDAGDANAHAQLGQALMKLGRPGEAAEAYTVALRRHPELPLLHLLQGNAHRAAGDIRLAIASYGRTTLLAPEMAGAWRNLGSALLGVDAHGDATAALRRACALEPDTAANWNSLGAALYAKGALPQALCAFREASRLTRDDEREGVRARWNLSLIYLALGDVSRGWPLYEYRRDGRCGGQMAPFGLPYLHGRPVAGMRILVTAEQGLGDIIMVLRFLPLLAAQGVEIVLQRPRPLRRLLMSVPGVHAFMDDGAAAPSVDCVLPCMSLPGLFVTDAGHVPGAVPYLQPDPDLAAAWGSRLGGASGLRVGFVWAGNPNHALDRIRSPGLAAISALMRIPGIVPVCLQVGPGRGDLAIHSLPPGAVDLGCDVTDAADTLAILSRLDLLVSCCTMPAHLAAAAGLPVDVLISAVPDWRWGMAVQHSPWYPGIRLFRQATPGDWASAVDQVAHDLTRRIGLPRQR